VKSPEPYRRCKCRDEHGRELGTACPRLRRRDGSWNPSHGTVYGQLELPAAPDGRRVTARFGGWRTEGDAREWFALAAQLLEIPEAGPAGHRERLEILDLIRQSRRQKAALPDYDDLRRRYRHGASFSAGTTGEYLLSWLADRKRAGDISKRTLTGYESHIVRIFLPAFGDEPLDKLRVSHVIGAFEAIDRENERIAAARQSADPVVRKSVAGKRITGAATKQRIRATLRSALSDAASAEHPLITVNVAKLIRLESGRRPKARVWTPARVEAWQAAYEQRLALLGPGAPLRDRFSAWHSLADRPSPVMVWTPAQTGAFLDAIAGHRLYPLFHLIAFRGLRRGEACGLRWADTDLDAGEVTILTQLVQNGWDVEEDSPKTDSSDAAVALDRATVTVLRTWWRAQLAERLAWGEGWVNTGRVFTREDGTDLHPAQATVAFERAAFEAGLPPLRLHDLRHSAASLAFAAGADIKAVQAMLRHSSVAITADTYTSVLPEVAADYAEKMAAIVPRRAVAAAGPGTAGLPSGSQSRTDGPGFSGGGKPVQVKRGGAPGARTQNRRIKSPLLCH
jgi:integrase